MNALELSQTCPTSCSLHARIHLHNREEDTGRHHERPAHEWQNAHLVCDLLSRGGEIDRFRHSLILHAGSHTDCFLQYTRCRCDLLRKGGRTIAPKHILTFLPEQARLFMFSLNPTPSYFYRSANEVAVCKRYVDASVTGKLDHCGQAPCDSCASKHACKRNSNCTIIALALVVCTIKYTNLTRLHANSMQNKILEKEKPATCRRHDQAALLEQPSQVGMVTLFFFRLQRQIFLPLLETLPLRNK